MLFGVGEAVRRACEDALRQMAEALAELWHRRIREEWGFADQDGPTLTGLFRQQYRGGRYSWGYPACPDLEDNATVAALLGAERIGLEGRGRFYEEVGAIRDVVQNHLLEVVEHLVLVTVEVVVVLVDLERVHLLLYNLVQFIQLQLVVVVMVET